MADADLGKAAKEMIDNEDIRPTQTRSHAEASTPEHIHEGTDVAIGPIAKFMAILFVGVGVVMVVIWGMFELLEARAAKGDRPRSPVYDTNRVLREPRLQDNPLVEMRTFQAAEDSAINGYGWVDKAAGIVHIPVDEAIERLAKQGLPTRAAQPAGGTASPERSSQGTVMTDTARQENSGGSAPKGTTATGK